MEISAEGISGEFAASLLKSDGFNELPSTRPRNLLQIALGVVREPMFTLLVACSLLYLFLGDAQEAVMLAGAVLVIMAITFYQERKTERTLEALRDLSSPRALVIRDGQQHRIPGREVVRGDLVVLSEGDRVPADGVLISCLGMSVDESLLTGESVTVRKSEGSPEIMERPGGDESPFVYSGTLVVQGRGIAQIRSTGLHTELGRIGKSLQTIGSETTLLQRSTGRLVRTFATIGLSLCVVVVLVYGLTRGSWLNGLLAGITMAISMIPEEFPVVLTIFLALGAWRIAQSNVLTRRVPAIETLGAATVLCVDKTGTLTQNRMAVHSLSVDGRILDVTGPTSGEPLSAAHAELLRFSILASQPDPFDPMERAIHHLGAQTPDFPPAFGEDWLLVRQYTLSPELLAMTHAWKSAEGPTHIVAAKGAPEAIATLCRLDPSQWQRVQSEVSTLASSGLRVIAAAKSDFEDAELPDAQGGFAFTFLGLVGLADPVRPAVADSLKECYTAGVRVIMITGDYPDTARSIARQISLNAPDETITGPELEAMSPEQLQDRIATVNIFARVMPEQKLLIVNALKARGEVVAMTGDGVNDAPALKSSHIGIAMGGRGTDVAREAAALVLLDDDFSSIVRAIRLGRRIYTNIKDAMAYVMAIHVPIAGLSLLPVLFGWPLILMPVHIVLLELIIDPACSIVFEMEPEEPDAMRRPPRNPNEPVFTRRALMLSLLQGATVLLVVLAVFLIALYRGQGEKDARALTYTTLIVANLCLILTNLSSTRPIMQVLRTPNRALWWVVGGVLASVSAVLYVPSLRGMFRFTYLHPVDLVIAFSAGFASILWFEALKSYRNQQREHSLSAPGR